MNNLTKQQQQIIFLALIFVIGGGWFYVKKMMSPLMTEIKKNEAKYAELEKKLENVKRQSKRLPALQEKHEKLKVELEAMEKQLPREKDLPGILRILTREAQSENITFSRLNPLKPRRDSSNYFEVVEFDISASGSLHGFVRFMSSLGQQERIFQFDKLSLTVGGGNSESTLGNIELNVNFNIKTYAYVG